MIEILSGLTVSLQSFLRILIITFFLLPQQVSSRQTDDNSDNRVKSKPDSVFIKIKRMLDVALARKDVKQVGVYYKHMAEILYKEGAIVQALEYYLRAYNLFKEENDLLNLAETQNRIGIIHFQSQRYSHSLANLKQALGIFKKLKHTNGIADAYSSIGTVYQRKHLDDSSSYFLNLALNELKKMKKGSETIRVYERMGSIYEDLKDFDNALKNFLSAQSLHIKNNTVITPGLLNNIGDVYRKKGNYEEALTYSKKAEQRALVINDVRQLSSAHRDLAKTFAALGNYDSAYYYSEKARYSYARTFNQENNEQLYLLQTLFDIQQKDNEISVLENERNRNRILSISMTIIGLLVGFLGFSIISRQRLKMQNERRLHQSDQKSMQLELNNKHLLEESLKDELELKSRELTSHTLHIIQKNQFLDELKNQIARIIKDDKRDQRKELKQLINLINLNSNQDKNWEDFRTVFENVHRNFFEKLNQHSSSLTATDLRFLALVKMNLSSSDIATMLGVSPDSLRTTRYRIRKKLQLPEEGSLHNFIQGI
ncbi:tetratricopeptide repeat protein [Pedobacter sp. P351]|uniref:tetratricopeptide repeat protein n=1 Tax=Pedobacter superstes TaxID=3133441 RepID=UPI0030B78C2E